MSIAAMILVTDRAVRRRLRVPATLRHDDMPTDAEILDLSVCGFRARTAGDLEVGDRIEVSWGAVCAAGAIVVRKGSDGYGCMFEHRLGDGMVADASPADTVVAFPRDEAPAEPPVARWRFQQRLAAILVGATATWAGVIGLGWAIYPLL